MSSTSLLPSTRPTFASLGNDQTAQAIFRTRSQHADAMHRRLRSDGTETEKYKKDYAEKSLHSITSPATDEQ
jgi:hypothetical protein